MKALLNTKNGYTARDSFDNDMGLRRTRKVGRAAKRLLNKDGLCLVQSVQAPLATIKHFKGWFVYLLDARWRFIVLIFAAGFVSSWAFYALLYYAQCYFHGDFDPNRNQTHRPCVQEIEGYVSAFLFSLETQHTIGYGSRHITEECPLTVIILCVQAVTGVLIQALLSGLVLAKMLRPKKRGQEIMFSQEAVICKEDGKLTLQFRLGDVTQTNIVEAHIRLYMIKNYTNKEGITHNLRQIEMNVGYDYGWDRLILMWPCIITHVIDKESPLRGLTQETLRNSQFELIAVIEGIVESIGMTFQLRTSYTPAEIRWNYRFSELAFFDQTAGQYRIYYENFNKIYPAEETINPVESSSSSESED